MRDPSIRRELKKLGFSEPTIRVLDKVIEIGSLISQQEDLNEAVEDATLSLTSLDARIDTLEAAGPYVEQDVGTAFADPTGTASRATFSTYAGQTVSNPPTQAEVQAIDDHVKVLSQTLAAVILDLRANGALT